MTDNPVETPATIERKHVYGWRRPLPGMEARLPRADTTGLVILDEVDPRPELPGIVDQLQIGACTANADAAVCEYDSICDGAPCGPLSRLWIYHFEMKLEGTLGQGDVGAIGHDGLKVARHGIPSEAVCPYSDNISDFEAPLPADLPRAYYLKKPVAAPAQSWTAVQQVLSHKQLVTFGFTVYQSFEGSWAQPGVMPVPAPGEQILGGHQVVAVGYLKDYPQLVLCRNSWGTSWGLAGYFFMPLSVFLDANQVNDFRTIVRAA